MYVYTAAALKQIKYYLQIQLQLIVCWCSLAKYTHTSKMYTRVVLFSYSRNYHAKSVFIYEYIYNIET
jgi:hypothetical protein